MFQGLPANNVQVVVLVTSGHCGPVLLTRSGILRKGLPAQWQSNTAVEAQYRGESPFFRLYLSFPLDGISLTLPTLHPSGTDGTLPLLHPSWDQTALFTPLRWTFAALRCRDLTGSSLVMSFSVHSILCALGLLWAPVCYDIEWLLK